MNDSAEFDILGLGTIAVDDTLYVERYPPPDEKARILREGRTFGGQVATALAAARKLGSRCTYGAVLGEDELATACRTALQSADVDCRFVRRQAGAGPVHSVIILDETTSTRTLFFDVSRVVPVPAAEASDAMIASGRVLLAKTCRGLKAILVAHACKGMRMMSRRAITGARDHQPEAFRDPQAGGRGGLRRLPRPLGRPSHPGNQGS